MHRVSLGQFITAVNLEIDEFTNGVFGLNELVDFADGENSLSEMYEEGITPKQAAKRVLAANGYYC